MRCQTALTGQGPAATARISGAWSSFIFGCTVGPVPRGINVQRPFRVLDVRRDAGRSIADRGRSRLMQPRRNHFDVLACPRCGGWLQLIATVEDPEAIRAILGGF